MVGGQKAWAYAGLVRRRPAHKAPAHKARTRAPRTRRAQGPRAQARTSPAHKHGRQPRTVAHKAAHRRIHAHLHTCTQMYYICTTEGTARLPGRRPPTVYCRVLHLYYGGHASRAAGRQPRTVAYYICTTDGTARLPGRRPPTATVAYYICTTEGTARRPGRRPPMEANTGAHKARTRNFEPGRGRTRVEPFVLAGNTGAHKARTRNFEPGRGRTKGRHLLPWEQTPVRTRRTHKGPAHKAPRTRMSHPRAHKDEPPPRA
jgi:hypothetical protein